MGDFCHQQCPAVSAPVEVYSFARKPEDRTFHFRINRGTRDHRKRAVRDLLYLYERISRVICIFSPSVTGADPARRNKGIDSLYPKAKKYSQHNLYALKCQSAQHYWYAIVPALPPNQGKKAERKRRPYSTFPWEYAVFPLFSMQI